jgi:hypothetical protein
LQLKEAMEPLILTPDFGEKHLLPPQAIDLFLETQVLAANLAQIKIVVPSGSQGDREVMDGSQEGSCGQHDEPLGQAHPLRGEPDFIGEEQEGKHQNHDKNGEAPSLM